MARERRLVLAVLGLGGVVIVLGGCTIKFLSARGAVVELPWWLAATGGNRFIAKNSLRVLDLRLLEFLDLSDPFFFAVGDVVSKFKSVDNSRV